MLLYVRGNPVSVHALTQSRALASLRTMAQHPAIRGSVDSGVHTPDSDAHHARDRGAAPRATDRRRAGSQPAR